MLVVESLTISHFTLRRYVKRYD